MNKTEITKIVEKELLEFFDAKTLLRHNKEIMEFSIEATLKAINYTRCCEELICDHCENIASVVICRCDKCDSNIHG